MAIAHTLSTLGLLLMGGLCAALSIILKHAWNPCNLVAFPDVGGGLTPVDCENILKGASAGWPNANAAENLIFALTLASRIEGCFFIGTGIGCFYALTLPLYARHAMMLPLAVVATLCACVDGNSAGLVPFGSNALVTPEGKVGGLPLMCLWLVIAVSLWVGFIGSERQDPRFAKIVKTARALHESQSAKAKTPAAAKPSGAGGKMAKKAN
jgi:hypothetical protein